MRDLKIFACVLLSCCILSGCATVEPIDNTDYFKVLTSNQDGKIVYDTRTGVQYWRTNDYSRSMTLLVDAEGKPLIYMEEENTED